MAARVTMIASGKGGTGKSTVAVFLAGRLAARGRRVMLIELSTALRSMDYPAGVSQQTVYDIGDVLAGRCDIAKAIVESPLYRGLYVVSAPTVGGEISTTGLSALVCAVAGLFDEIVLDVASGLGAVFEAAAAVSGLALLVITPEPAAMRAGRIVCDCLRERGIAQIRLIINQVTPMNEESVVQDLDECIDTVGARLLGVIPQSASLARAAATGQGLLPPRQDTAHAVFRAMAARLCGEQIPLLVE